MQVASRQRLEMQWILRSAHGTAPAVPAWDDWKGRGDQCFGSSVVVAVSGGTFEGPRLKGTVIGPAGDWIVQRDDGSRLLDVRALLQTDDGQRVYVMWRGIAYTPPGGTLHARILPMFETGAAKYARLNNVVAVGLYRPSAGKILYRVYEIL